jgi:hypothetical protein
VSHEYAAPPPPPRPSRTVYRPSRTVYRSPPTTVYTSPDVYTSPGVYTSPSAVYAPPSTVVVPRSATDEAFQSGLWAGRVEAVAVAGAGYYLYQKLNGDEDDGDFESPDGFISYSDELMRTTLMMDTLREEFGSTDPLVSAIQVPASGKYTGESAEDDDGDQSVMTHLAFEKDGRIRGWGNDGVDGRYKIKQGRWSSAEDGTGGARVAWIESYDDGFEVALRGQVRQSDGAILGMWASSRGVSGSVKLDAPV